MGTNYFWYLDQEIMHSPELYKLNTNISEIVKDIYYSALKAEEEVNSERTSYLRQDDSIVKDFSYEPGLIKVKALHIGKKSYGWCFGLHVYPEMIDIYQEWVELFQYGLIKNEYGDLITKDQMLEIIDVNGLDGINQLQDVKDRRKNCLSLDAYSCYDDQYCIYRRVPDGRYCNGYYKAVDYCLGHFS